MSLLFLYNSIFYSLERSFLLATKDLWLLLTKYMSKALNLTYIYKGEHAVFAFLYVTTSFTMVVSRPIYLHEKSHNLFFLNS